MLDDDPLKGKEGRKEVMGLGGKENSGWEVIVQVQKRISASWEKLPIWFSVFKIFTRE